jgi:hypothetical protein
MADQPKRWIPPSAAIFALAAISSTNVLAAKHDLQRIEANLQRVEQAQARITPTARPTARPGPSPELVALRREAATKRARLDDLLKNHKDVMKALPTVVRRDKPLPIPVRRTETLGRWAAGAPGRQRIPEAVRKAREMKLPQPKDRPPHQRSR